MSEEKIPVMISKPMMICDECGKLKEDTVVVIDPYIEEVCEEKVKRALCEECYLERVMEI